MSGSQRSHLPTSTDFDVCEECAVPTLFSLTQMRNLRFALEMRPEAAYLSCPTIGKRLPVLVSTTRRLVLDLLTIQGAHPGLRIVDAGVADATCEFPSFLAVDPPVRSWSLVLSEP